MRSMQRQLGKAGTISAFALGPRETKKNLCRGGRSQDLPDTDLQPAVRWLSNIINESLQKNKDFHAVFVVTGKMWNSSSYFIRIPRIISYCLQTVAASKIELLNLRLPEDGAELRRIAQENIIQRVSTIGALTFWPRSFTFKFQHTLYVKCE